MPLEPMRPVAPREPDGSDAHDGVFIVFEGIDGAGTTTQAERCAALLRARRRVVQVTREPSAGPIGSLLRLVLTGRLALPRKNHAELMALLFAADRIDHVETEVAPHLRDGCVVISDRYDLSSLAYQVTTAIDEGKNAAESLGWIRGLNRHALRPDLTVVFDISPDVAASRRKARGGARELFEDAELQVRLAQAYLRAEELVPGDRVVHVDANGSPDEVSAAISAAMAPFVGG